MDKDHLFYDESMWKGAPKSGFDRARELRNQMTDAEAILWEAIRNKRFLGLKFRRQHPLHLFVVDFYCHSLKLVIEVDGACHNSVRQ